MVSFAVKLIKVPSLSNLSGWEVFDLTLNARHVGGDYWIFEGDIEALEIENVSVVAEGITEGFGDFDTFELVEHCDEIFGVDLRHEPPSWKMIAER